MRAAALLLALAACSAEEDRLRAERDRIAAENQQLREELRVLRTQLDEPRSAETGSRGPTDYVASIIIDVAADGAITTEGVTVPAGALDSLFEGAFAKNPRTQVVIQSAHGAPHPVVVDIMERAKAAGITHLAIGASSR